MSELLSELDEQINIDKELIQVSPKNGIKAIQALKTNLKTMIAKYEEMNGNLLKEIERRYNELSNVNLNPEIDSKKEELEELISRIAIVDDRKTFEKIQFDKITYNINGYYKNDLETTNNEIMSAINELEDVGVDVSGADFDISEYANEYMTVLIDEARRGNANSERVKDTFDKIYWKCSELISHVYVNLRQIYDNHEQEIQGYYVDRIEKILVSLRTNIEKLENKKNSLLREKIELEAVDDKLILDGFLAGNLNINDFKKEFYESTYTELISKDFSSLSPEEKADMDENIKKLYENLIEFSKFLEYSFLCDEILKIREEEVKKIEDNKNNKVKIKVTELEAIKKEIAKNIEEINRINEKDNKPKKHGLFGKSVARTSISSSDSLKRNNFISEVKKLYLQLDDIRIKNEIVEKVTETSTLFDVLKLASYYYGFMARAIIKKNNEVTDKEISEMIKNIRDYISLTNFAVINNVNALENKDLAIIIKDKYKLYGMNLTKENFLADTVEDLIRRVKNLYDYNNIENSNWKIGEIDYIIRAKELLKK